MDSVFVEQDAIARSTSSVPPTHYILKVQSFSSLVENAVEKYETGEFEAGGYKWKLVVYPNGNKNKNVKDHISLNLTIANAGSLGFGWEVYVIFRLFLLDQHKDRYLILQDAMGNGRRFHELKLEWGFDQFIPFTTFNDASNGYLVKDTCVFGADVFVKERNINKGECLSMIKSTSASSYKHVWKINNFSMLETKGYESEVFVAGDQKWKIHLCPKRNNGGDGSHLSMYLELVDLSTISVYVGFTLRFQSQLLQVYKDSKASAWFGASKQEWGWDRFVELRNLKNMNSGSILRDVFLVEAEVTVLGISKAL